MKAMIMAAGVGSRLMPLTENLPKPMVPIGNKPVMEYAVDLLKRHNITEVIANLHYLPEVIKDYFGNGSSFGINLNFSAELALLGTAGGVKNNEWFLDETFIILSGDGLTDVDLTEMIEFHKEKKSLATIALKKVDNVEQFGVVILDEENKIQSFQEKPKKEEALSDLVNTGIYIFDKEIFKYIPEQEVFDFGKQLFPLLVSKGLPFFGYETDSYWCDVGSLEAYRQANFDLLDGKLNYKIPHSISNEKIFAARTVKIDPSVKIEGKVLLGEGSVLREGVELRGNVILGPNCTVGPNTIIKDSILWNNVSLKEDNILQDCIIGRRSLLEKGVIVRDGCVLSDNCKIESFAEILSGKKLPEGSVIKEFSVAG